jgi:hypothetical protein
MDQIMLDQIKKYRQIIKQIITQYAQIRPALAEIEIETIFDEQNDHYEITITMK